MLSKYDILLLSQFCTLFMELKNPQAIGALLYILERGAFPDCSFWDSNKYP